MSLEWNGVCSDWIEACTQVATSLWQLHRKNYNSSWNVIDILFTWVVSGWFWIGRDGWAVKCRWAYSSWISFACLHKAGREQGEYLSLLILVEPCWTLHLVCIWCAQTVSWIEYCFRPARGAWHWLSHCDGVTRSLVTLLEESRVRFFDFGILEVDCYKLFQVCCRRHRAWYRYRWRHVDMSGIKPKEFSYMGFQTLRFILGCSKVSLEA